MNNVLGREKNNSLPDAMLFNGQELRGTALADYMNSYFVNVPVCPHDALELTDQRISFVSNSIFLEPTDECEVFGVFTRPRNSRALDVDNLQIIPIKYVLPSIVSAIAHIFNVALESGTFPSAMKRSRVSLIYKGGNRNLPTN